MVQEGPNMYFSDLSSSSEGILGIQEESETSKFRFAMGISNRGQKIRRKFQKHKQCFFTEGGSCSYDDETIVNIEVSLMYKHIVKQWVPKDLPQLNEYF